MPHDVTHKSLMSHTPGALHNQAGGLPGVASMYVWLIGHSGTGVHWGFCNLIL